MAFACGKRQGYGRIACIADKQFGIKLVIGDKVQAAIPVKIPGSGDLLEVQVIIIGGFVFRVFDGGFRFVIFKNYRVGRLIFRIKLLYLGQFFIAQNRISAMGKLVLAK